MTEQETKLSELAEARKALDDALEELAAAARAKDAAMIEDALADLRAIA